MDSNHIFCVIFSLGRPFPLFVVRGVVFWLVCSSEINVPPWSMLSLSWDSCISLSSALFVFTLVSFVYDDCSGACCIVLSFKQCFSTPFSFTRDALFNELSFSSKLSISSCVSDKTFDLFIGFCIGEERFLLLGGVRNMMYLLSGVISLVSLVIIIA